MKTLGYVRVSTDKQAEQGVSLEAQAEKIRAMAVVHNAKLAEIIVDAESAKSLNRPGMARLLAMVDAGEVQTVIIAKLKRHQEPKPPWHGEVACDGRCRRSANGHHRQAGPAHPQREGPLHAAGAVRTTGCGAGIGGRIARHELCCRQASAEYHDGGQSMGTGGNRGTDPGRHAPQAEQWRARRQHLVWLPARGRWSASGTGSGRANGAG